MQLRQFWSRGVRGKVVAVGLELAGAHLHGYQRPQASRSRGWGLGYTRCGCYGYGCHPWRADKDVVNCRPLREEIMALPAIAGQGEA